MKAGFLSIRKKSPGFCFRRLLHKLRGAI